MSRIQQEIDLNGRECWTAFDPERRHSFITSAAAANEHRTKLRHPYRTLLTGTPQPIRETCLVMAKVEGRPVHFLANVVEEIGFDEDGRAIDVLFGSLAMKQSNIQIDPVSGRLDFTHYGRMIVEFC